MMHGQTKIKLTTDIHALGRIQIHNSSNQVAADTHLRPRWHWNRLFFWHKNTQWARASSFMRFLDHTQRHTSVGRTPLDEWSACRRDLYL